VREMAREEGVGTRIVEYSLLLDDKLGIWVLSGAGDLLCCTTVPTTVLGGGSADDDAQGRTIQQLLAQSRKSMNVRGRDAMGRSAEEADVMGVEVEARGVEGDEGRGPCDTAPPEHRAKATCKV
jgi:hypothetical protein